MNEERRRGIVGVAFGVLCVIAAMVGMAQAGYAMMLPLFLAAVIAGIVFALIRGRK